MKRIAKVLSLLLALALAIAALAACGGSDGGGAASGTAGSGGEQPTYVDTGEYTGDPMEIVFSFASSENFCSLYVDVEKRITERTGGKVTFLNYFGGSLASATESLDACGSGMCDMADITLTNFKDRFPYSQQVNEYPFLGYKSLAMAVDVMNEFIPNNEYCMAEFDKANIHPVFFVGVWGTSLVMRENVDIKVPQDLAGKKIMATSDIENEFILAAGGTPVAQPPTEMYSCMQNGVIDGVMIGLYVTNIFGALQLAKSVYMLENSFTTGLRVFAVNKDMWESFTPDLQAIFEDEFSNETFWTEAKKFWDDQDQGHLDDCEEWGIPVTWIEGADMDPWKEMAKPFGDAKLQALKDAGNEHVDEVFAELTAAIDNYDGRFK